MESQQTKREYTEIKNELNKMNSLYMEKKRENEMLNMSVSNMS